MKKITIPEEAYWKLMEIKVKLKCRTWKDLANKLHTKVLQTHLSRFGDVDS